MSPVSFSTRSTLTTTTSSRSPAASSSSSRDRPSSTTISSLTSSSGYPQPLQKHLEHLHENEAPKSDVGGSEVDPEAVFEGEAPRQQVSGLDSHPGLWLLRWHAAGAEWSSMMMQPFVFLFYKVYPVIMYSNKPCSV
uniref:Uncharacterized protein n=1 Tax=Arundo donax TaxID=35708 RepID=A0A0A9DUU7_ARUDO